VWWKPANTLVNTSLINLEAKFDELSHFRHSDEATKYELTGCYPRNISTCVVFWIRQGAYTKRSWGFTLFTFEICVLLTLTSGPQSLMNVRILKYARIKHFFCFDYTVSFSDFAVANGRIYD
jgi:hypothetical protein